MVNANDLKTVLESETDLHWTVSKDKPTVKEFVAVSFTYNLEYFEEKDHWRFSFRDKAPEAQEALGGVDTDDVLEEFRGFVSETYSDAKR